MIVTDWPILTTKCMDIVAKSTFLLHDAEVYEAENGVNEKKTSLEDATAHKYLVLMREPQRLSKVLEQLLSHPHVHVQMNVPYAMQLQHEQIIIIPL